MWPIEFITSGNDTPASCVQFSNAAGDTFSTAADPGSGVIYGPYLKEIPELPVGSKKGASGVFTATTGIPPGGLATDGWFYNTTTFSIYANLPDTDVDVDGNKYNAF